MLQALTVRNEHSDLFTYLRGDLQACATMCRTPEEACSESLVYASDATQLRQALRQRASILIVHQSLAESLPAGEEHLGCCFSVPEIELGMAVLLTYFDAKSNRFTQWGKRHATAIIHPSATIGTDVTLGPYCVVGAEAFVGNGCFIGAHTVIENRARIGAGTTLHPHVFVGCACEIGRNCEIHPHSSIGSDGFGYALDADGRPRKIPQLGNVKIGDEVEIGSNCAIDRATLTSTYVRSGTKLDNICHIAHNCDLGENGFFTAGFMMAGSTKIGRNFRTGGNSVVAGHITLADNVVLAGRSTVTNDIKTAGRYGGYPLQPLKEALKTLVSIGQLNRIRKDLNKAMKHLQLTGKEEKTSAE